METALPLAGTLLGITFGLVSGVSREEKIKQIAISVFGTIIVAFIGVSFYAYGYSLEVLLGFLIWSFIGFIPTFIIGLGYRRRRDKPWIGVMPSFRGPDRWEVMEIQKNAPKIDAELTTIYNIFLGYKVEISLKMQNIIGSSALRGKENHFWLKAISTSRNLGLSFIFIGQRLSDISTKAVERCNGYLLGKMTGDNDLRKVKALGGKQLREQVKKLKVGSFIYYNGNATEQIDFPLFESYGRPKPYELESNVEIGSGLLEKIRRWFA